MRSSAAATAVVSALGLALAAAPAAWAASDCQIAFEKWARLSTARVRTVAQGGSDGGRGGCIPSEAVRDSLLDALARTRSLCAGAGLDPSLQQTLTLININHSFIAALGVCRSESVDAGDGWLTKSSPAPERPPPERKVAAPLAKPPPAAAAPPPAPRDVGPRPAAVAPPRPPAGGGPRPAVIAPPRAPASGGPRPAVIAPPPAPAPKAAVAAAAPPPKPPCLEMSESGQAGRYAFVNRRCRGHSVIAVIETRGPSGKTSCKGYEIDRTLALLAPSDAPPRINYECVASQKRCNKGRLGDMFPECDW